MRFLITFPYYLLPIGHFFFFFFSSCLSWHLTLLTPAGTGAGSSTALFLWHFSLIFYIRALVANHLSSAEHIYPFSTLPCLHLAFFRAFTFSHSRALSTTYRASGFSPAYVQHTLQRYYQSAHIHGCFLDLQDRTEIEARRGRFTTLRYVYTLVHRGMNHPFRHSTKPKPRNRVPLS